LNQYNISNGKWDNELEVTDKFTNFHKCPFYLSNSDKPGMKLLYALTDGIAKNYNASLNTMEHKNIYAIHVPFATNENPKTTLMQIYVAPQQKPIFTTKYLQL
jgi:hypothetical protein